MGKADEVRGVFNFTGGFPGEHLVRVKFNRDFAWKAVREMLYCLQHDHEYVTISSFGTLLRDAEEDNGNPIEVEK